LKRQPCKSVLVYVYDPAADQVSVITVQDSRSGV